VNGQCSVPDDACTVEVSGGEARYWTSAADGPYAFYTEGKELYRFDAEPEAEQESHEALTGANAGVLGVLGVSHNGEVIYFVANGVLSGGSGEGAMPVEGEPNLYMLRHGVAPVFIGTLSKQDGNEVGPFFTSLGGEFSDWQAGLGQRTSRVTGDGGSIVFMSNQPLSVVGYPHGYPNRGQEEVYIYQTRSNGLYCATCGDTHEGASGFLPVSWDDTYLPQWIAEDGNRVLFDSGSSLVPQDTNGQQDVYEWEREGEGSCTNDSAVNGGCVFLLSGGTSQANSWLIGASESGNDVFLATRAQLVPEDQNDAFNLFDARVDGVKPVSSQECAGTGCQGVPLPPPTFATPSSATFDGVGNFTPASAPVVKARAKTLTRAQRFTNALKSCHKKSRHKRASCEAWARKRDGPVKKDHKTSPAVSKRRK
jgi:hypothetical protein